MSEIDKELSSMSLLGLVAWQELGRRPGDAYDYHENHDIVPEGYVPKNYQATYLWPQMVLLGKELLFYADSKEMQSVGETDCFKKFYQYLMRARNTLRDGSKRPRWIWQVVKNPPKRGKFPPRVYTKHRLNELKDEMHFICKYTDSVSKEYILSVIDGWNMSTTNLKTEQYLGCIDPEFTISWRPRYILRALVKIGINLLSHICEKTIVSKDTFSEAIGFVLDDRGKGPSWGDSGFVRNEDLQALNCPARAHKFRLTYGPNWSLDCAFFGGKIGATVAFPGPNHESWARAEVTVPLGSVDWRIERFQIVVPRRMSVEWDVTKVVPSILLKNVRSVFRMDVRQT
jgi:hypothetical protein